MDRHIFICYKHEDNDFAENLIHRVEKAGFKTWVDSDKLHAGEDWRIEIDQAIKIALALIVIMTPAAKASEYVTYEWAFALGADVKVIPIMLEITDLHPRLEALQYLDFTNRINRPWEKLIEIVKKAGTRKDLFQPNISQDIPLYIRQAIIGLNNVSRSDRESAIETLAEVRYSNILIEALKFPIQDVRWNASKALGEIKDPAAVPGLLEVLHDSNEKVRWNASKALGEIKDPAAVPGLLEALHDSDEKVRHATIWALGEINNSLAIPNLLQVLYNSSEEVETCRITSEALGKIKEAVPCLIEALQYPNENVRHNVIQVLGKIKEAVPNLIEALQHPNEIVRRDASWALGAIKDPIAVPGLLQALRDSSKKVRRTASWALGAIKDPIAVPGLLQTLNEPDLRLRFSVLTALESIKDPTAIPALLQVINDSNEDVQKVAKRVLKHLQSNEI